MGNRVITCLLIYTFIFMNTRWCRCNENSPSNSTVRCKHSERAALLNFKHSVTYFDKNVSSSWKSEECCNWKRVGCDNTTGHILKLDLNGNPSNNLLKMENLESLVYLLELRQLESLDLGNNNFSYCSIPILMGSMKQLRYLDLSCACLGGLIPYELGNLSNLQYLDLTFNKLTGEIPASLGKLSNLNKLYLPNNKLSGKIPTSIGELSRLQRLDLSFNNLSTIASSLRFPSKLKHLDLSNNHLTSKMPTSLLGELSNLRILDISFNPLEGTVLSEHHFVNLSNLKGLDMYDTLLTLNLSSDWVLPFQLEYFIACNCKINGQIPPWLQTQKNLSVLNLSGANVYGLMPSWFHTMQQLYSLDLSNNNLSGSYTFPINFDYIDLANNSLSGEFLSNGSRTQVYPNAYHISLSDNLISGPLPESLGHIMPNLEELYLSNNQISGQILNSLCQLTSLIILDINNNSLSGEIPNCIANLSNLSLVRLSYNKLKGHIPCFNNSETYNSAFGMEFYLHLNDNMLNGEIPSCLSDLTNLKVLDIGGNQLSGKMLKWFSVAEKFRELRILRLRGNRFSGPIPRLICSLPRLQIMDLGLNLFKGSIPPCLSNLTAMTSPPTASQMTETNEVSETYDVSEVTQGVERAYTRTLPYLVDIDLSFNNLVGSIPDDMTKISGLLSLNLSYNQLSGTIPVNIEGLKSLVSLDLSNNKLRGSIPTSIGELYMLSHLNLSYNNLSGPIPTGNELQTLSDQASIYAGNPHLCGDFLPKKCKSKVDEQDNKGRSKKVKGNNKEKFEKMGFGLVVMSGFATGFWGVVGGLALNRRWRHAVFRRVEDDYDWLYVIVAVRVAKVRRNNRR